eukprot:gene3500-3999_t
MYLLPSLKENKNTSADKGSRGRRDERDEQGDAEVTTHVRRVQRTEIVTSEIVSNTNGDNDDDDVDSRRQRARDKYEAKRREEEEEASSSGLFKGDDDEEEEEEESEYETDDEEEEEEDWGKPMFRPTFVAKDVRGTIKTDEQYEKEEEEERIRVEREKEERKQEAHRKLRDELERDMKEQAAKEEEEREAADDDDEDPDKVYAEWMAREIARLKQEILTKLVIEADEREIERRRKMTDKEIEEEDAEKLKREPKKQLKFMQKDYHRGAFFQDDEYIKNKDFSGATGEDRFNRELLPEIMRVKGFGKAGRTKYTHLADQDTSSREQLWGQNNSEKPSTNRQTNSFYWSVVHTRSDLDSIFNNKKSVPTEHQKRFEGRAADCKYFAENVSAPPWIPAHHTSRGPLTITALVHS